MADIEMSIKSNVDAFAKELDDFARKQLPFAVSKAINDLARQVVKGEMDQITQDFPTATPFTKRGPGYIPSNKNKLEAVVFIKDIQATYLEPYAFGGKQVPAKPKGVAILTPKNIALNQYGNIPYLKTRSLKSRGDVFSGDIKLKNGMRIGGIFQRMKAKKGGDRLKILIRFTDPQTVKKHFDFEQRARSTVERGFDTAMRNAMNYALATSK